MDNPEVILRYVAPRNPDQPAKGSNKFYHMYDNGDGTWYARYGREGYSGQKTKNYSKSRWDTKYREKLRKGYVDVTPKGEVVTSSFTDIEDPQIQKFLDLLMSVSQHRVKTTYKVSSADVSAYTVEQAQKILDELVYETNEDSSLKTLNEILLRLYVFIPRKMDIVDDHLLKTKDNILNVLEEEQDNLDALSSQVQMQGSNNGATVTEALGLEIQKASVNELEDLEMIHSPRNFFKVVNKKTQKRYNDLLENTTGKVLSGFHSSRDSNWLSILQKGLMIKPAGVAANGSLYGNGIYLSTNITKSLSYAKGDHKIVGVFEAFVGKQKVVSYPNYETQRYTLDRVKRMGYNSVYVNKFGADEVIVYSPEQVTIKYIFKV